MTVIESNFQKKCLRHFLPDCSYELSKGNRDFFACLKITTHKLQRALVATSFNNWAAISFTQLWHIGVKSLLNLVSYACITLQIYTIELRWNYSLSSYLSIFRCNVPLHLNIPIAKVRYPKIYSDMIVKCQ